jgi:hypothetical protein
VISVPLPDIIFVPFLFSLVALFACYLYYAVWRAAPRAPSRRERIYRCAACGHVYVEARDVPMARCPRCDNMNEAMKR